MEKSNRNKGIKTMKTVNDLGTSGGNCAETVPMRRLRWDHENLSRSTGARQSKAYRDEVAREIAALESEKQIGG